MQAGLVSIIDKIEEILIPESTANAVVIFANGEKTCASYAIDGIIRNLRLKRKALGILFHLWGRDDGSTPHRIELFEDLSSTEQDMLESRVKRYLNGLQSGEFDDDFDEFESEEEEQAVEILDGAIV